MPVLLQSPNTSQIYLAINDQIISWNTKDDQINSNKLPEIIIPATLKLNDQQVKTLKEQAEITISQISDDYNYILVSTQNKQVVIFNKNLEVQHNFLLKRVASQIRFFPLDSKKLIIADKTGDAYVYDLEKQENQFILGHMSMLMDILLTKDEKFVITCDRDEKIRVTHYPNSYNILSFCLGHLEFVTHIEVIDKYLLSASGDGSIRIWDFKAGTEQGKVDTNLQVNDEGINLEKFCSEMEVDNIEIRALPILDMQVSQIDINIFMVAVKLLGINSVLIYRLDLHDKCTLEFVQTLKIHENILSINLCKNTLLILTEQMCKMFEFGNSLFSLTKENMKLHEVFKDVIGKYSHLDGKNRMVTFYKRKFDNVQEYLQRKKMRMEKK